MKPNNKNIKKLTTREQEVLNLLKFAMNDFEIGEELCISHHTAHTHRKSIYKKLDVHSDLEAALKGINLGYINL